MKNYVSYESSAPYFVLNELNENTTDVWVVFHGFAQLAERFIQKFDFLPDSHFIIAPQGMSRFYFDNYQKVGASWITRMEKDIDLINQQAYLNQVVQSALNQKELNDFKVHVFGFSQGVSTACRWVAHQKVVVENIILWAGGFPLDLKPEDFTHLKDSALLQIVYGEQDEFLPSKSNLELGIQNAENVLNRKAEIVTFSGGHRIDPKMLQSLKF